MAPSVPEPSRSRGRPVEIDREHLAQVALRLFQERSYDSVSAAEIASAAGISRRSLFRYFPTKADLVWDRFDQSLEILRTALPTAPGEPVKAAKAALLMVADQTQVVELTRERLQLIGSHAELFAFGMRKLQQQAEILRLYLLERGLSALEARVIASGLTMASFSGYLHWASASEEEHPLPVIGEAMGALSLL